MRPVRVPAGSATRTPASGLSPKPDQGTHTEHAPERVMAPPGLLRNRRYALSRSPQGLQRVREASWCQSNSPSASATGCVGGATQTPSTRDPWQAWLVAAWSSCDALLPRVLPELLPASAAPEMEPRTRAACAPGS